VNPDSGPAPAPAPATWHEGGIAVRAATLDDTPEVIRLAGLMYAAMGMDASGHAWREAAGQALATRLGRDTAVFVADSPAAAGRLAAAGAGTIARRLPAPANPGPGSVTSNGYPQIPGGDGVAWPVRSPLR
jgi:hypothetical protein